MKAKKLHLIGIAIFVVLLVAVGVMVWPEPKPAMAANWTATLSQNWNGFNMRNTNPTVQFYSATMAPIGNQVAMNDMIVQWDKYRETLDDGGATIYYIMFRWDYDPNGLDQGSEWRIPGGGPVVDPINGVPVQANTGGTILNVQKD